MSTIDVSKPLPLRRMVWVTWRQHRLALLGVAVVVVTAAGCLLISGIRMRAALAAARTYACPADGAPCASVLVHLVIGFDRSVNGVVLLYAVPGLIGMFVGAPLLAREFELGTVPFAWCQGITPLRWTVAKLVLVGGAVGAAVVPISLLMAWWFPSGAFVLWGHTDVLWYSPLAQFYLFPVAYVRWTLLAFVLGVLAGALLRRTVPAMVLAGAGYAAFLLFATSLNYYQAPGYWLWLLTEGDGLLVYTGLLVAVLLWFVHRRAGRTR